MPERIERLHETLAELRGELRELDSLDEPTRQLLEGAADELHKALDPHDETELEHQSLSERFRQSTERFEESHPTLARIVGNMIDALGQIGI